MKIRAKIPPRHKLPPEPMPEPGDLVDDGTVFLGCYREREWYAAAKDVLGAFNEVAKPGREIHGHNDWQLPSPDILKALYENKSKGAFKGTFTEKLVFEGWYWSSKEVTKPRDLFPSTEARHFYDGNVDPKSAYHKLPARFVRSVPRRKP